MNALVLLLAIGQTDTTLEVAEHQPIVVTTGVVAADGWRVTHSWRVAPPALHLPVADGSSIHVWAPPGTYQIEHTAFLVNFTEQAMDVRVEQFVVKVGPRGPPEPDSPPDPLEPPPGPRLVAVIYESSQTRIPLHVHAARVQLEEMGHRVLVLDKDTQTGDNQTPEVLRPILAALDGVGLPALVVVAGDRVHRTIELPPTTGGVISEALR